MVDKNQFKTSSKELISLINSNFDATQSAWLLEKVDQIAANKTARNFFLTFSLCGHKIDKKAISDFNDVGVGLKNYLKNHKINQVQLARLYLLMKVLEENADFYIPKVSQLIQIADSKELETILRYLIWLPYREKFKMAAVDTLRTNIATVFDAISADNPYPALYFDDQQWNQMFLKAAFMGRDLSNIMCIAERANKELSRIISDYAHERWAASREVEPDFWRPVPQFIEGQILEDMNRLLNSKNHIERKAGALCCYQSDNEEAKQLLYKVPELKERLEKGTLTWTNYKN